MKKLLLSLGTLAAVAAPVATVVACGSSHSKGGAKGKPGKTEGPSITTTQAAINAAAHATEVAATSKNGTKANNVDGEDLTRPFNDIADTQDENTVYQSSGVTTKVFDGSMPLTSKIMSLKDFSAETKDFDFNNFTSLEVHISKTKDFGGTPGGSSLTFSAIGQKQTLSDRTFWDGKDHKGVYIGILISKDGSIKINRKDRGYTDSHDSYIDRDGVFTGKEGFIIDKITVKTRQKPYWASLIPTKVTPTQFKWNADECHSIVDIIKQMNSQLHFNFQKKLEKMTPLEFADYIANLVINNGGGDWDFKVNYKGESDDVNLKPAPVLNRFMKALDGDANPTNSKDWHFQAISDKTPMAVSSLGHMAGKINIGSFMSMLNAHLDVLPDPLDPVFELMGNFPNDAVNVFPDFLELFLNMGQAFHDSPVAQKWAADQDAATQAKFADIKNEIIRTVLQSGK